jgi:hypothetical protein
VITDKNGPFRVRVLKLVVSDLPECVTGGRRRYLPAGECEAWCNRHGAVWGITPDGDTLGLRPAEFEYITLPPDGLPLALTPHGARELVDRLTRQGMTA